VFHSLQSQCLSLSRLSFSSFSGPSCPLACSLTKYYTLSSNWRSNHGAHTKQFLAQILSVPSSALRRLLFSPALPHRLSCAQCTPCVSPSVTWNHSTFFVTMTNHRWWMQSPGTAGSSETALMVRRQAVPLDFWDLWKDQHYPARVDKTSALNISSWCRWNTSSSFIMMIYSEYHLHWYFYKLYLTSM
jgi:hypothetical protein